MRLKKALVGLGAAMLLALPLAGQRGAEAAPPAGSAAPKAGAPAKKGAAPAASAAPSAQPAAPPAGAPPTAAPASPDAAPPPGAPPAPPGAPPAPPGAAVPAGQQPPGKAGPPGPQPVAAQGAPQGPAMDGPTYAVRLRDLEQRIDELKEQIRRSHTRLSLLSDTILSGGGAGSRASIKFQNELSSAFRVTRVLVVLDGAVQYNKTDQSGALADQAEIPVFNGSVPPGDHTLQVLVNLQGNGYGVFSYLRGYRFEVRSSHSFTAVEGKTINLQAVSYEKGGVTTPLEERPAVRYVEKVVAGLVDASAQPAAAAQPVQTMPAAPPPTK
ncbi:Dihydrolipoamide acetyltransferase component of pyruvate dehydrogenase complex [Minicystis rosea]|nr:Dihydrolipoamide acetyltransferase component of pyruvate dehydrogenase complex [Minicystis rosea]